MLKNLHKVIKLLARKGEIYPNSVKLLTDSIAFQQILINTMYQPLLCTEDTAVSKTETLSDFREFKNKQ